MHGKSTHTYLSNLEAARCCIRCNDCAFCILRLPFLAVTTCITGSGRLEHQGLVFPAACFGDPSKADPGAAGDASARMAFPSSWPTELRDKVPVFMDNGTKVATLLFPDHAAIAMDPGVTFTKESFELGLRNEIGVVAAAVVAGGVADTAGIKNGDRITHIGTVSLWTASAQDAQQILVEAAASASSGAVQLRLVVPSKLLTTNDFGGHLNVQHTVRTYINMIRCRTILSPCAN